MQLSTSCAVNPDTDVAVKQIISMQLCTSCALESPMLASEVSLRGDKMDAWNEPGTGSASFILHVIGRNKTRTGFEKHMLLFTRGRLVPRQPRAFKSITATQLLHEKHLSAWRNAYCHS